MNNSGFTITEIITIIVILAIILIIAIPRVSGLIEKVTINAFLADTRLVLKSIAYEKLKDKDFNPRLISENNIQQYLNLSNQNYEIIKTSNYNDEFYIEITGKNKWAGLISCGTFNMVRLGTVDNCYEDVLLINKFETELTGDGIYEYRNNAYYFGGSNPHNWVIFGDSSQENNNPILWRVLKYDNEGIRIIYEGVKNNNEIPIQNGRIIIDGSTTAPWDSGNTNHWEKPATLKPLLTIWYNNLDAFDKNNFVNPIKWCVGRIDDQYVDLYHFLDQECADKGPIKGLTSSTSPIGLIRLSDYIFTSTEESCLEGNIFDCKNDNFLYKIEYNWWSLNAVEGSIHSLWIIDSSGNFVSSIANNETVSVRPIINLRWDVLYAGGDGTLNNPYQIK